jgi:hypothetical protein
MRSRESMLRKWANEPKVTWKYTMAIDPGGTSGLAFRMPDGEIITARAVTFEQVLDYFLGDIHKPEQVVLEEWTYFSMKVTPQGALTADICAGVRGVCYVQHIPLALRVPAARQPMQDAAERWYKQTKKKRTIAKIDSHECDALAHLLTWENLHPDLQRQTNARH